MLIDVFRRPVGARLRILAGAAAVIAPFAILAQDLDVTQLQELDDDRDDILHEGFTIDQIEDMRVLRDGQEIGEVEAVLADASGAVVALAIELEDRIRDDDDVVVAIDAVEFTAEGREVSTTLSDEELAALPSWDD